MSTPVVKSSSGTACHPLPYFSLGGGGRLAWRGGINMKNKITPPYGHPSRGEL